MRLMFARLGLPGMCLGCRQIGRAEEGEPGRGFSSQALPASVPALSMAALVPESRGGLSYLSSLAGPGAEGNLSLGANVLRWCWLRAVNHSAVQALRRLALGGTLPLPLPSCLGIPPTPHPHPKSWYKAGPAGVCGEGGAGSPHNGQGSKYRYCLAGLPPRSHPCWETTGLLTWGAVWQR